MRRRHLVERGEAVLGQRSLAQAMSQARAQEYRDLTERAQQVARTSPTTVEVGRALKRLRKDLRTVQRRDYFPPAERDDAVAAINRPRTTTPCSHSPARSSTASSTTAAAA